MIMMKKTVVVTSWLWVTEKVSWFAKWSWAMLGRGDQTFYVQFPDGSEGRRTSLRDARMYARAFGGKAVRREGGEIVVWYEHEGEE